MGFELDVNITLYVITFGILVYLACKVLFDRQHKFLTNINWRDKLSLADIEEQSADYWALVMHESTDQEQQSFCFKKVHSAIKTAKTLNDTTNTKDLKVSYETNKSVPDNVVTLRS